MASTPAGAAEDFDPSGGKGLRVLATHIAHKCVQAASVGGSASMPISFVWRKIKKQPVDFVSLSRTAGRVHLVLLGLTGVAGAAKVSQLDQEGQEDRGYRLHYNIHQGRTDIFSTVGAGVGVIAASLALRGLRPPATPASYLGCLSLGVTGGVLAHVLTTSRTHE